MDIVLFEDAGFADLLPLTFWRATFELRCGCGSLLDHARARYPNARFTLFTRPELADVVMARTSLPVNTAPQSDTLLLINGRLLLREPLPDTTDSGVCRAGDTVLWAVVHGPAARMLNADACLDPKKLSAVLSSLPRTRPASDYPTAITYPWDLINNNADMIVHAWRRLSVRGIEGQVYDGAHIVEPQNVCIGRGSRIKPSVVLDAEDGPIVIGEHVTIQPNATVLGPCFIGDGSLIQTGASLRGGTSIGRVCKIGGEIEGSILHGYSNKQHDGFLGHAYVAEHCNLAADTVNSDLKNTYGPVRVPINGVCVDSGQMFVGVTLGDHAKTGIGQLFPTGSVVGFASSVATSGLAPKFVPSFRWLTDETNEPYDVERCLAVARTVMARRRLQMSEAEERLFRRLPAIAKHYERVLPETELPTFADVPASGRG